MLARARPSLEAVSDERLVASVADGSADAFACLYDRHGRMAYALAVRVLRNPALAEDAVQEAFLDLWRTAVRFVPGRSAARSWILMLVHRRAVDAVRREERRAPAGEELAEELTSGSAAEEASLNVERLRVREALQTLPALQRQALELAYWGGLTQREVAEKLDEPLGTIKSRMFAGLASLRDALAA